jgi:hypothetical protein
MVSRPFAQGVSGEPSSGLESPVPSLQRGEADQGFLFLTDGEGPTLRVSPRVTGFLRVVPGRSAPLTTREQTRWRHARHEAGLRPGTCCNETTGERRTRHRRPMTTPEDGRLKCEAHLTPLVLQLCSRIETFRTTFLEPWPTPSTQRVVPRSDTAEPDPTVTHPRHDTAR